MNPLADEPAPFLLGKMVLTVELDANGARMFGMNIETSPGEPTKMYDVLAMLGFAAQNTNDPEWRDLAYGAPEGDDQQ